MSEDPEKDLDVKDLASLDIEALEGIGGKAATRLKSVNITTIGELEACEPPVIYEQAKISLYKLYELRRKAQLVLGVSRALKADEPTLKILGENGYSITRTIEEDPAVLQGLTQQPQEHLVTIRDNLLLLLIGLEDHIARRKGSIALLRKTKKRRRPAEEEPLPSEVTEPTPTEPTPTPTLAVEPPTRELVKGGISAGAGGFVAGLAGTALYLHPFVTAGIGVIAGAGIWYALHTLWKD